MSFNYVNYKEIVKFIENYNSGLIYDYARKFGFGSKTGITLPSEANGILNTYSDWTHVSDVYVSIGQEINSTTLQTAMAYSVIANGGYLLRPQILRNITNKNEILYESHPIVIRKVISNSTANKIISILEGVVESGSGSKAQINGYKIAGKTGTSETFKNGIKSNTNYISSFAGIFPSNQPKYVCVISIDSPAVYGSHWGGVSAAPTVRNIFRRIITESTDISPFEPKVLVGDAKI